MTQSVHLIPYSTDGQALLQHRDAGAPHYPSCWALFGGAIEHSESAEAALERELFEELGVDLDADSCAFVGNVTDRESGVVCLVFTAPMAWNVDDLRAQQTEGDNLGLFSVEEMGALKMPEHIREALGMAKEAGVLR